MMELNKKQKELINKLDDKTKKKLVNMYYKLYFINFLKEIKSGNKMQKD